MPNVAYSKYMYCAVAANIPQKIKNCAFIYFSTQYMKIILQKIKKNRPCFSPLLKIKGTKSIGKSPQFWQTSTTSSVQQSTSEFRDTLYYSVTLYTYKVSSL